LQYEKHLEQRISTLFGMTIDRIDEDENASDSIRANREFDSNLRDECKSQHEKQFKPAISTLSGIKID
jgi:hypothetical protein